ncbi:MAG: hypothetical protein J0L77_09180 [Alphaproteobacteria bacterium]|nr:hypothetical protein [Alphaproteobacteria bacterium]
MTTKRENPFLRLMKPDVGFEIEIEPSNDLRRRVSGEFGISANVDLEEQSIIGKGVTDEQQPEALPDIPPSKKFLL